MLFRVFVSDIKRKNGSQCVHRKDPQAAMQTIIRWQLTDEQWSGCWGKFCCPSPNNTKGYIYPPDWSDLTARQMQHGAGGQWAPSDLSLRPWI